MFYPQNDSLLWDFLKELYGEFQEEYYTAVEGVKFINLFSTNVPAYSRREYNFHRPLLKPTDNRERISFFQSNVRCKP